ncbi:MAG TPA: glycosyltransferase family 4 protein [Candidatus Dormibacteraeota bacterium]|nr:glycosyltransferase family 4 protein [Candidatus Dormibacteraeota bacterium]
MRVLHINDIASTASTLVAAQRELGHDATLRRLRLVAGARSMPVKLLALPARLAELREVNADVRRVRPDVVHIHYAYLGWAGIVGRYPYVLHCHGTDVRAGLRDPLRGPLVRRSLRAASLVLVSTPDLLPLVRPIRSDAQFLPNPVDTSAFLPVEDQAPPPPTAILLISAFSEVKGIDVAIEAVRLLRARRPAVHVTAIDHGPLASRYRDEPGLRFVPPRRHADMARLIADHAVVVGQFGIGSLGMAELESMGCGRPVVCHHAHDGSYSEPPPLLTAGTAAEAAEHLERLVDDPAGAVALGARASAWVRRHHGYLEVGRQVLAAYATMGSRAVSGRSSASP